MELKIYKPILSVVDEGCGTPWKSTNIIEINATITGENSICTKYVKRVISNINLNFFKPLR